VVSFNIPHSAIFVKFIAQCEIIVTKNESRMSIHFSNIQGQWILNP